MFIIIVNGERIGYFLAKALLKEGHEVLIVERDADKCQRIKEELGEVCLVGDGSEVSVLAEAGTERADMLIAVTDKDEDNLVACQVAKHKFGIRRTIARISDPENEALFKRLGVDITVSSTSLILEHIEEEVPTHPLVHLLQLEEKDMEIVEVKILPNSPSIGKRLKEIPLPSGAIPSLLIRRDEPLQIPNQDTVLEAEDRLIIATYPQAEEMLKSALLGDATP